MDRQFAERLNKMEEEDISVRSLAKAEAIVQLLEDYVADGDRGLTKLSIAAGLQVMENDIIELWEGV